MDAAYIRELTAELVDARGRVVRRFDVPCDRVPIWHRGLPQLLWQLRVLYFTEIRAHFNVGSRPLFSVIAPVGAPALNFLAAPAAYAALRRRQPLDPGAEMAVDLRVVITVLMDRHRALWVLDAFRALLNYS